MGVRTTYFLSLLLALGVFVCLNGCGDLGLGTTSDTSSSGEGISRDPSSGNTVDRNDTTNSQTETDSSSDEGSTDTPTYDDSGSSDSADEPVYDPEPDPEPAEEPSADPEPVVLGDPVMGKSLFQLNCQHCHGANGAGGSAPAIAGASSSRILSMFGGTNGHTRFYSLSEADATDISAFLNSVQ